MSTQLQHINIESPDRFYPDHFMLDNFWLFCAFIPGSIQYLLPKEGEPMR